MLLMLPAIGGIRQIAEQICDNAGVQRQADRQIGFPLSDGSTNPAAGSPTDMTKYVAGS